MHLDNAIFHDSGYVKEELPPLRTVSSNEDVGDFPDNFVSLCAGRKWTNVSEKLLYTTPYAHILFYARTTAADCFLYIEIKKIFTIEKSLFLQNFKDKVSLAHYDAVLVELRVVRISLIIGLIIPIIYPVVEVILDLLLNL